VDNRTTVKYTFWQIRGGMFRMSKRMLETSKTGAVVLASLLFLFAAGCHKKAPAPPPPPPAAPPPAPPAPAKPSIDSFTAEPSTIERGQSSTLRWSVSNATDISIDESIGAVQSNGSRQVFPSNTTTYTLTAKGPGGTDSRSATVEVTVAPPPPPPAPPTVKRSAADILASDVHDAYFDFDKYDIRSDAQQVLTQDAGVLKQIFSDNPSFTVVLEGHCDERGSAEYNLGLGDKRASSAKDFLVQLGVPADRMKTISYGKERPVCTDQTEECYQRNRHVHFSPAQ
jgi:peptidoglycan-associated lipoprotein